MRTDKYVWILISILLAIVIFDLDRYTYNPIKDKEIYNSNDLIELVDNESELEDIDVVKATKYNPVPEQCDGDPLVTADNSKIDIRKLKRHELKWVAISRDLRSKYSYGDTIIVESDNPNLNGEWVVKDTMNPRFRSRIDFLVPENDRYQFHSPIEVTIRKKIFKGD